MIKTNKKLNEIFIIFCVISTFITYTFFAMTSIVGYEYEGSESTYIYSIYNISIFIFIWIFIFKNMIKKSIKYSMNELFILSIPVIILLIYIIEFLLGNTNRVSLDRLTFFILWSMTSYFVAFIIVKFQIQNKIEYYSKYISLLLIASSIIVFITSIITGNRAQLGGASYQTAGYSSALAFGLNLFYLNNKKINKSKIEIAFRVSSIPLIVLAVFISGARGALIVVLSYIIYYFVYYLIQYNKVKHIVYIIIFSFVLILFVNQLINIEIFSKSFNRLFEYINKDGIDWSGTSGRDLLYAEAIGFVKDSPIIGYGFFGLSKIFTYPHNLFLEVLLQGGVFYLSIMIIICTYVLYKLFYKMPKFHFLHIIFIHSFIYLMFSGTYIETYFFWFSISTVLCISSINKTGEFNRKNEKI